MWINHTLYPHYTGLSLACALLHHTCVHESWPGRWVWSPEGYSDGKRRSRAKGRMMAWRSTQPENGKGNSAR